METVSGLLLKVNDENMALQKAIGENEREQQYVAEKQASASTAMSNVLAKKREMADKQNLCMRGEAEVLMAVRINHGP